MTDVRVPCPAPSSFTRLWAIAFILLYPVGIPFFSILVMVYMGLYQLAKQKVLFPTVLYIPIFRVVACNVGFDLCKICVDRLMLLLFLRCHRHGIT